MAPASFSFERCEAIVREQRRRINYLLENDKVSRDIYTLLRSYRAKMHNLITPAVFLRMLASTAVALFFNQMQPGCYSIGENGYLISFHMVLALAVSAASYIILIEVIFENFFLGIIEKMKLLFEDDSNIQRYRAITEIYPDLKFAYIEVIAK